MTKFPAILHFSIKIITISGALSFTKMYIRRHSPLQDRFGKKSLHNGINFIMLYHLLVSELFDTIPPPCYHLCILE